MKSRMEIFVEIVENCSTSVLPHRALIMLCIFAFVYQYFKRDNSQDKSL